MEIRFCKECGAKLDASCRFCMSCGTPVDEWLTNESEESKETVPERPYVVVNRDKPEKKLKENKTMARHGQRGVGGVLLSVMLCVLLFAFLLLSIGIVSIRQASSPLAIRRMLEAVDITELPLSNGNDIGSVLKESVLELLDITDDVSEMINSETVRIAVSDKLSAYLRDIYSDTGEGVVSSADVIDLLHKLDDDIEEDLGISLYSSDYELIEEVLQEQGFLDDLNLSAYKKNHSIEYQVLHWGLSYYAVAALLVLCLLMVLLVHCSNKKVYRYTVSNVGVTLTLEGAILLIGYYANSWILVQLSSLLKFDRILVGAVSKGVLGACLPVLYAVTIAGLVLVIAGIILKALYKRVRQRKAAGL